MFMDCTIRLRRRAAIHTIVGAFLLLIIGPTLAAETPPNRGTNDGDLNRDGRRDLADVALLLDHVLHGSALPTALADVDRDGRVDMSDVLFLLSGIQPDSPRNAPVMLPRDSFGDQVRSADFIFQGVVRAISYGSSLESGSTPALPHTFVTLSIERVFKGIPPEFPEEITLRFLGGPSPDGRILDTSLTPHFLVGQREVLLVKNNGDYACPLAYGLARRFRLIDGQTFSEDGREVRIDAVGQLGFGAWHELDAVRIVRVGDQVFERRFSPPVDEANTPLLPPQSRGLDPDLFADFLSRVVQSVHSTSDLRSLRPVASVDPSLPFTFELGAAKGAIVGLEAPGGQVLPDDPSERAAITERGGDPVLPSPSQTRD
ncbi:MAG: dockerin type I repeat-containing protein [Planctomycetes bacterium]|nr:dockerin type I repeat-containing protein [Planctomycetota bacterium]